MKPRHAVALASLILGISGCPTRQKYDQMPTVRITSPSDPSYTNGPVHITATVDPPLDLPIVLRVDTDEIKTLASPSESYDWNTTGVPEGAHTLVAEVAFSSGLAKSSPIIVNVDRKPPTVTLTPAPGASNVVLRSPIKASFSEPVVLSQPVGQTFSLSIAGTTVPTTVTFDAQNQTATIAIDDLYSFALPAVLAATIESTIADRAGNSLVPPVGTWSWSVPDSIAIPRLDSASRPVFAVGSDLAPVLGWTLFTYVGGTLNYQLQVAKYNGVGWTQLGPPSSNVNSAAGAYDISLDAADRPFAIWKETPGTLQVASWTGSGWDASLPAISSAFGSNALSGSAILHLDGVGRPVVLWHETAPSGLHDYFVTRWNGKEWDRSFDPIEFADYVTFDMAAAENPVVSWILPAGTGHLSLWSGTDWTAAPDVPGMAEPFIALDSAHSPMVVTAQSGSFLVQRLVGGNAWQLLPAVSVPPQARYPRIAAGPDGLPLIAWFDAQTKSVGMARWTGQRWDTRAAFAFGPNATDEPPQLVVDRQGSAWVGWRDNQLNLSMTNY